MKNVSLDSHSTLAVELLEDRTLLAASPIGPEFRVNNTITGAQVTTPRPGSIAADPAGNFVVVWSSEGQDGSSYGVYARRYSKAGTPLANEFRVNQTTLGNQGEPVVAMDADGDIVVVWTSDGQDGSGLGVYARRYSPTGLPLTGEFRVNQSTAGDQWSPSVAMDALGNFTVAWQSENQDGSFDGIIARRFSAIGTPLTNEFIVNASTFGSQVTPTVAMNAAGSFVVAWTGVGQDLFSDGVYARRFSAAGVPQGGDILVNTYLIDNQTLPAVVVQPNGDFVVAWTSFGQDLSGAGVYAQRFNAAGAKQGGEFRVNQTTFKDQIGPAIAARPNNAFVVTWASDGQDGSFFGIFAREYNANGVATSNEFRVNTRTQDEQAYPSIASNAEGDYIITWSSLNQDGSSTGVYAQRYDVPTPLSVSINGRTSAVRSQPLTYTLTAADATATSFTYSIDWNGDGIVDQTLVGPSTVNVPRTFGTAGNFNVRVFVTTPDDRVSSTVVRSVQITEQLLEVDAADPTKTNLLIGGTPLIDVYYLYPGILQVFAENNQIFGTILPNGEFVGTTILRPLPAFNGKLVVFAGDGTDVILGEIYDKPMELYGGGGPDALFGGFAADRLDGGDGPDLLRGGRFSSTGDTLIGGDGDDVLIGSAATDVLFGGAGNDLIITGPVQFTGYETGRLYDLRAEWSSSRTYNQKIANLSGTGTGPRANNDTFLIPGQTIVDDPVVDVALGQEGQDWLLLDIGEDVGDAVAGEVVTDLL
jgi:hypothetical protein